MFSDFRPGVPGVPQSRRLPDQKRQTKGDLPGVHHLDDRLGKLLLRDAGGLIGAAELLGQGQHHNLLPRFHIRTKRLLELHRRNLGGFGQPLRYGQFFIKLFPGKIFAFYIPFLIKENRDAQQLHLQGFQL